MSPRNIFLALFLAAAALAVAGLGISGPALGQSGTAWKHVRTVGMIDMVLVDRARDKDKDVYRMAIGSVCGPKLKRGFCKVLFWSDPSMVPRSMPMTAAQVSAMRADWTYNDRASFRQLLWACDIEPDPAQCFKP